jgi:hypothetical protein
MTKYIQSSKGYFYKIENNGLKKRVSKEEFYKKKKFVKKGGSITEKNKNDFLKFIKTQQYSWGNIIKLSPLTDIHSIIYLIKDIIKTDNRNYLAHLKKEDFESIGPGINILELKSAGFTVDQLKIMGYTKQDIQTFYSQIYGSSKITDNFTNNELIKIGFKNNELSKLKTLS